MSDFHLFWLLSTQSGRSTLPWEEGLLQVQAAALNHVMAKFGEPIIAAPTSDRWGRTMGIPDSDAAYYRMREQHERNLADKTTLDEARIIHQTLADKYRSLAARVDRVQDSDIVSPPDQLASHRI